MRQSTAVRAGWLIIVLLVLAGCGAAAPVPEATSPSVATVPAGSTGPDSGLRSLRPQAVTFKSTDGTDIAALYYPPARTPAPGVVLMHMMGGSKADWAQFATLLQGAAIAQAGQGLQAAQSYAVLAIDFRGHGDSGGSSSDQPGKLGDAKAALEFIKAQPEVDKTRIVMIGASIGADAAVDQCGEGCIGAVSLSPGGFLGVPYNDALKALGAKPVLCVASAGDTTSADTCTQGESAGLSDFQVQIYQGPAHGTAMFRISDQKPLLTDLLFAWLRGHVTG
jgi:dienelactone hydrolase